MDLFVDGKFTSHAGKTLTFKIDCDAISDQSLACIAKQVAKHISFSRVYGVPTGGQRLAEALTPYVDPTQNMTLIVDDVMTTGTSMVDAVQTLEEGTPYIGVVLFSRCLWPNILNKWVIPIFRLENIWIDD